MRQRVISVELNLRKGIVTIESFTTWCSYLDSTWSLLKIEFDLVYLRPIVVIVSDRSDIVFLLLEFAFPDCI